MSTWLSSYSASSASSMTPVLFWSSSSLADRAMTSIDPAPTVEAPTDTAAGCFDVSGAWTTDRAQCATKERQAEILGVEPVQDKISDEDFTRETDKLFSGGETLRMQKVAALQTVLTESIQRIDVLINNPASVDAEQALVTRDWLTRQQQTLSTDTVEDVWESVRVIFTDTRDDAFFARLDKIRDGMLSAIAVMIREELDLPLEQVFEFQRQSSLIELPSCRTAGTSCEAIEPFLELLEQMRASMENIAQLNGKNYVLDEIEALFD